MQLHLSFLAATALLGLTIAAPMPTSGGLTAGEKSTEVGAGDVPAFGAEYPPQDVIDQQGPKKKWMPNIASALEPLVKGGNPHGFGRGYDSGTVGLIEPEKPAGGQTGEKPGQN
jgi:hypothetical protein